MKRDKTGGRVKGTLNRTTAETKVLIQNIVSNELDNIIDLLARLQPKERLDIIIKLLPYIIPKQNEISLERQISLEKKEIEFTPIIINLITEKDQQDENNN